MPAKPLAFIVMIRLKTLFALAASARMSKKETRIIIRNRQMLVEAIVKIVRTGLRRTLRSM